MTRAMVERSTRELGAVFTSPLFTTFAYVIIDADASSRAIRHIRASWNYTAITTNVSVMTATLICSLTYPIDRTCAIVDVEAGGFLATSDAFPALLALTKSFNAFPMLC